MPFAQGHLLKQLTFTTLILRILAGGMLLLLAFTGSAHAETISADPSNVTVVSAPRPLRLTFDAPADPDQTTVSVFTTNHEPVAVGPLRSSGDPLALLLDIPALTPGVYTVIWHSGWLAAVLNRRSLIAPERPRLGVARTASATD